jgi:hypothetical protein
MEHQTQYVMSIFHYLQPPTKEPATMLDTISIHGLTFTVPSPYGPGHICSTAEARILNQILHARLRKNFAENVEAIPTGGIDKAKRDELQRELDAYAATFSLNGPDPTQAEAIALAISIIKCKLRAEKKLVKEVPQSALREAAEKLLQGPSGQSILCMARVRVIEFQRLAAEELARVEGSH